MSVDIDKTPSTFLGRVYSKVRRTLRDYKRTKLRARFALTAPCLKSVSDDRFSIHMLICKRDLLMGICAVKSFYLSVEQCYTITFHDDGSLGSGEYLLLERHFPGSIIITYAESLDKAKEVFGKDSIVYKYRLKGVMLLKLLDVKLFSNKPKAVLLDSDVLFFKKPEVLLDAALDIKSVNYFNKDIDSAYMMDRKYLETITGYPLPERLNAGLSVIHTDVIDFDKISNWLHEIEKANQPFIMHRIEQTLISMLVGGSSYGYDVLPEGYDVALQKEVDTSVCKHYVGIIRHGFELEGLRYLLSKQDYERRWLKFTSTLV